MAKGKHAVALFEVIQSSKSSRKGVSLRTPKWWFKGKQTAGSTAAAPAPPELAAAAPLPNPRPTPASSPVVVEPDVTATAPGPRMNGIDLRLDPDRQRISFHFTYTSAIVTVFAVLVAVGLAYIIGRHVAAGPSLAMAGPSSEEIRKGPVKSGVLEVKSGADVVRNTRSPTAGQRANSGNDPEDAIRAVPVAPQPSQHGNANAATATTQPAGRVIGLNYVVVQIYPEEKTAIEARDLLARNGIASTIEKGLTGYAASNWYCVVGMTGFDRIRNNPEYDKYERSIRSLSDKITQDRKFKRFDPQAYRWKGN
jgi:hypothetical protein